MPLTSVARTIVACACLCAVSYPCRGDEGAPKFGITVDTPRTGSIIRRDQVLSSVLPLNRSYQQLTPEERAIVHGWYEHIAPGDEPPFPLDGLRSIDEAVQQGQQKRKVNGDLQMTATIEPSGKVSAVKVYTSPDPEMTTFVGAVLLLTKFKPAVCGGRPCRMDFPVSYGFELEP